MMRWIEDLVQSDAPLVWDSVADGSSSGGGAPGGAAALTPAGIVAIVLIAEVVVIGTLLCCLYRRKKATEAFAERESALNQSLLPGGADAATTYRWVMFVTVGMFSGYASLVLLQHHLMGVMEDNITNDHSAECGQNATTATDCTLSNGDSGMCGFKGYATSGPLACKMGDDQQESFEDKFKHAASFNYIGNLIFRIAHNFVFAPFIPRHRVVISLAAMLTSMLLIGLGVYQFAGTSLAWVYVSYAIGGVGVGTFESNMLAAIAPLGHDTKVLRK